VLRTYIAAITASGTIGAELFCCALIRFAPEPRDKIVIEYVFPLRIRNVLAQAKFAIGHYIEE